MRKDPPVISEDQNLIDASMLILREEIEVLPVVSSDGSEGWWEYKSARSDSKSY